MRYVGVALLAVGGCAEFDCAPDNEPSGGRSAAVDRVFMEDGQRKYERGVFLKIDLFGWE